MPTLAVMLPEGSMLRSQFSNPGVICIPLAANALVPYPVLSPKTERPIPVNSLTLALVLFFKILFS